MRTHLILAAALTTLLAEPALAVDFKPTNYGSIEFDMPGNNICCSYYPKASDGAKLSCSRVNPKYWTVVLTPRGQMTVYKDPGEVPGCGYGEPLGNIFTYGSTWKKDGITCTSSKKGMTCKANGKGFTLSRAGLVKY